MRYEKKIVLFLIGYVGIFFAVTLGAFYTAKYVYSLRSEFTSLSAEYGRLFQDLKIAALLSLSFLTLLPVVMHIYARSKGHIALKIASSIFIVVMMIFDILLYLELYYFYF